MQRIWTFFYKDRKSISPHDLYYILADIDHERHLPIAPKGAHATVAAPKNHRKPRVNPKNESKDQD